MFGRSKSFDIHQLIMIKCKISSKESVSEESIETKFHEDMSESPETEKK